MTPPSNPVIVLRSSLLLLVAVILQVTLVASLRIGGAQADVMLLIGIAAGLSAGRQRGAIYGFAAGLVYDLLLTTPLGLSALTYALVGHLAGTAREAILRSAWWIPMASAAAGSALGVILYVVLGTVVGQESRGLPIVTIVVVVALVNGLMAPLAVKVVGWAVGEGHARRLGLVVR
jgi:rod shape-determining protein MreD